MKRAYGFTGIYLLLLALERYAPAPVTSNAFFLQGAVKPLEEQRKIQSTAAISRVNGRRFSWGVL